MKAIVLLNSAAGTLCGQPEATATEAVARALTEAEIDFSILPVDAAGLTLAREAVENEEADVVIAGGGDGTLSAVAGIVAGTDIPLGILPLGTLNHFAKDLRIPFGLPEAIRVIADGNIGQIDVGEVNGRVFINNSSLGLYPRTVLERDSHQHRFGLRKWTAMFLAMLKVFRRFPLVRVRLQAGETTIFRKSPLVFIGNNIYELELFRVGKRSSLDRGKLSLYIANTQSRWGIVILSLRALFGRLRQARDFETFQLTSCGIETRKHWLHVAVDGEVVKMNPPLEYRVRPRALRVCLPVATTSPEDSATATTPYVAETEPASDRTPS